jgi:hypothetical protein
MRKAKSAMQHLLMCKAEGICARDKLVNEYLQKRIDVYERRMQTVNEAAREDYCLPRCPPVCPPPNGEDVDVTIIEETEIQHVR